MANFGDMLEITCTHLGKDYRFDPKANESFTTDRGGVRTNDDMNQVTSNGKNMRQMNRVRWMVEGPISNEPTTEDDLSLLAKAVSEGTWTFVTTSGQIYKGRGCPVGDIQTDKNAGTITLKVSGGGLLELI